MNKKKSSVKNLLKKNQMQEAEAEELKNKRAKNKNASSKNGQENNEESDESKHEEEKPNFVLETSKNVNSKEYIISLFPKLLFAELYFAWSKDCNENITVENAKWFRDELLLRKNKDERYCNFKSMRVGKNFLQAFLGNLTTHQIITIDLSDNLINDVCMHTIKNLIASKKLVTLNLASNMISSEGLKIIQEDIIYSNTLTYLNLGIQEGSFRRNNFSGEGGLILAKIMVLNKSIKSLFLQDNELGEDNGEKLGAALFENKEIRKLKVSENKLKNRGAKAILENSLNLVALNLSKNEINSEICPDLKRLLKHSVNIQELYWDSNLIGVKGIYYIVDGLKSSKSLKHLSLKDTGLGNNGIICLAEGLKNNKLLNALDISSNSISIEGFTVICEMLLTSNIKTLKSKNNLLGDEAAKIFSKKILSEEFPCALEYFDFSSCKIYDQGLIYMLNELQHNNKIKRIKLKDNYFSHEIDYVIVDFLEKNSCLLLFDLSKNRLSYQCLLKIKKIVERNIKIENDKEPNKLLVEVYRLKYENTKLNEMKDELKVLENEVEKIKLNRADIRQEYENFKRECEEENEKYKISIAKNKFKLKEKEEELVQKRTEFENLKEKNQEEITNLNKKMNDLKEKKTLVETEVDKMKIQNEELEKDYIKKIEEIYKKIDENKQKTEDYNKEAKNFMEEIRRLDKLIDKKKSELGTSQNNNINK